MTRADASRSSARQRGDIELSDPEAVQSRTVDKQPKERRIENRAAVACTVCRKQHLRCDSRTPSCSRCRSLGKRCVYTDIRRPRRSPRKVRRRGLAQGMHNDEGLSERCQSFRLPLSTDGGSQEQPLEIEAGLFPADDGVYPFEIRTNTPGIGGLSPPIVPPSDLQELGIFVAGTDGFHSSISLTTNEPLSSIPLDGFYKYFFPAHPFVLPRAQLTSQRDTDPDSVCHLVTIMTLIGELYTYDKQSHTRRQDAERVLESALPSTGFTVQTLMLVALCLEWSGEGERAGTTMQRAKDMALDIGMDRKTYAINHGRGSPVLEESWRRTWWELYIIDAFFAGIRHWPTFSLWKLGADVYLPVDEDYYISGDIPQPRTLQEYDDRCFQEEEDPFSSFTYLIDAARILGTALGAGDIAGGSPSSLVKNAETNLLSWDLHLPQSKRDPIRPNGTVDEVLFRAHLLVKTVAIHLHRPRSALHYTTMELLSSKYAPPLPAELIPPHEAQPDRHTSAAIRASGAFIDLLAAPTTLTAHTPFVMCMGSMAVVTHLSACEYRLRGAEFGRARDRVRVFLGVLRAFGGVWDQASRWGREIRMMARTVFGGRDGDGELVLDPSVGEDVLGAELQRVHNIIEGAL